MKLHGPGGTGVANKRGQSRRRAQRERPEQRHRVEDMTSDRVVGGGKAKESRS